MKKLDLTNHFLVSTNSRDRSLFGGSIVYLCRHDHEGAFGLIINKPSDTSVEDLLDSLEVEHPQSFDEDRWVLHGGPVKTKQVLVLHSLPADDFDVTIRVGSSAAVTLSRDILTAIAENKAPGRMLFAFGYSSWGPGQLEDEIRENTWIAIPAKPEMIFDTPAESRLSRAVRDFGFDITSFSEISGHA